MNIWSKEKNTKNFKLFNEKEEAIQYLQEHIDCDSRINGTVVLNRLQNGMTYEEWVDDVNKFLDNEYSTQKMAPASTFFTIRESDNKIVGMVNIRHYLNDDLDRSGGHIGYGIRPSERQKEYAKIQLYLALIEANKMGLDKVMIDCLNTNDASDRTIKALGGVFEREEYEELKDRTLNVYRVDVNESLDKFKDKYFDYVKEKEKHI